MIDDTNDRRVHGDERVRKRQGGFPRTRQITEIARPGLGSVDGHMRIARRATLMVDGLHDEEFCAFQSLVFTLGDDGADHATEIHSE